jgi:hypothetical protein
MGKYYEALEVILTEGEKREISEKQTERILERLRLKSDAKRQAENFASKIKLIDQEIENAAFLLDNGKEFREVECDWREDWYAKEKYLIRLDTYAEIRRRPMSPEERQARLFENPSGHDGSEPPKSTEPTTEDGQASEPTDEERARIHQEAISRWRRESPPIATRAQNETKPAEGEKESALDEKLSGETVEQAAIRMATEEASQEDFCADYPDNEIEARANSEEEWDALLDQAEAELEAENAAKPDWQTRPLDYEDYLAFALSTGIKNPASHAQKWNVTGEKEADVRFFLRDQEERADTFTADKCMECKALDGAHAINCTFHPDFALNITPKKSRKGNSVQPTR